MPTSLVVLSHGFWGSRRHMSCIEQEIKRQYENSVYVLNLDCNETTYSYDGIDLCGQRAADQVVKKCKELKNVKKISFIGYSMGGLILRYAIGVLGRYGLFEYIEPLYFVSFATPHMGIKMTAPGVFSTVYNYLTGRFLSRTGDQLQLRDQFSHNGDPIIRVLSNPTEIYFKYLERFKYKRVYANVANDFSVPYWTAGIENMDYFENQKKKLDVEIDDNYPSLLTSFDLPSGRKTPFSVDITASSPWEYVINSMLVPIFPIYLSLLLFFLGTCGMISRKRVAKMLINQKLLMTNANQTKDQQEQNIILDKHSDTINIPVDNKSFFYSPAEPSKALLLKSKPLQFDKDLEQIFDNLSQVRWERFWVYIKSVSAHGSIVCLDNEGGRVTIQHFIDTTFFN